MYWDVNDVEIPRRRRGKVLNSVVVRVKSRVINCGRQTSLTWSRSSCKGDIQSASLNQFYMQTG